MAQYEKIERLGAGNFGEVWLEFDHALGVKRAVKHVRPSRIQDPSEFFSEPKVLMRLRHENIVRVEDAGIEPDGSLYIAMEFLPRGSLDKIYKGRPVPLRRAMEILQDVCRGLQYSHQAGYIHRDIKPGNILEADNEVAKLSDFGLATRAPRGQIASPIGYLTHLAPEVFQNDETNNLSDIYALGVTAYRLVNGDAYLPDVDNEEGLKELIIRGKYPDRKHYRAYVPRQIRLIINRAMHIDPSNRYQSATDFRRALEQVTLYGNWTAEPIDGTEEYKMAIADTTIKCTVTRNRNGTHSVVTTKQKASKTPRRVLKDCRENIPSTALQAFLHKMLCRYVIEGN